MNITQLEHLLSLMEQYRLEELEWQSDGESIRLKKQAGTERGAAVSLLDTAAGQTVAGQTVAGQIAVDGIGVSAFTAQPTAGAVAVGGAVSAGQTVTDMTQSQQVAQPDDLTAITAEMIGTFYSAPSPEAEPFVSVGDIVEKGAVLCVLEAMKLMNEVEAPYKLRIESIEVGNGSVVEYGQTLFKVREVQ